MGREDEVDEKVAVLEPDHPHSVVVEQQQRANQDETRTRTRKHRLLSLNFFHKLSLKFHSLGYRSNTTNLLRSDLSTPSHQLHLPSSHPRHPLFLISPLRMSGRIPIGSAFLLTVAITGLGYGIMSRPSSFPSPPLSLADPFSSSHHADGRAVLRLALARPQKEGRRAQEAEAGCGGGQREDGSDSGALTFFLCSSPTRH